MGAFLLTGKPTRLLDTNQLADLLGITVEAIYSRRQRGGDSLPPALRIGRSLRWRIEDVESWLSERREGAGR